ncbi:hypothetical protein D1AOALGA4SA_12943 [Olavius algarvensis Delta 1 endosymbiont]|nr:hypothetical protein D1AOALGA4SA_12943 [Olavius algarvensis Delta 1 endosymbiont]
MFETTPGDLRRGYAVVSVIIYWRLIVVCHLVFVIWDLFVICYLYFGIYL